MKTRMMKMISLMALLVGMLSFTSCEVELWYEDDYCGNNYEDTRTSFCPVCQYVSRKFFYPSLFLSLLHYRTRYSLLIFSLFILVKLWNIIYFCDIM